MLSWTLKNGIEDDDEIVICDKVSSLTALYQEDAPIL
jgi:hypothetical protein